MPLRAAVRCLVVSGGPGIGKSTLLGVAAESLSGWDVVRAIGGAAASGARVGLMSPAPSTFLRLLAMAAVGCAATTALATLAGTAAHAAPATAAAATSTAMCPTSGLVVWLDTQANGAAGSSYYKLEFTNLSAHACTLRGYPGVSAVNLAGRQLGSPASRNNAHPARLVRLASGATATAVLQITDAHNFPGAACRPATAAGLRVYPPSETASRRVPFPFLACARSGPHYLHAEAVQ